MAIIYIALLDHKDQMHLAKVDISEHPLHQWDVVDIDVFKDGVEILNYLEKPVLRGINIISNISANSIGAMEKRFIASLADFWKRLPPAKEEKDALFVVREGKGDFIRTSPEIAKDLWQGMGSIGSE